jgi:Family of unknown function (DUF7003)
MTDGDTRPDADVLLRQLDQATRDFGFPGPPNMNQPTAAGRLAVFASDDESLAVFQTIALARSDRDFVRLTYCFGSGVAEPGLRGWQSVISSAGDPLWREDEQGYEHFALDALQFSVEMNGQNRSYSLTPDDYRRAGLDPDDDGGEPELRFVRLLAALAPDDLLQPAAELAGACGRSDLRLLVTVDEWQQPDLSEEVMPSELECFRSLARAISTGDPGAFRCPLDGATSHWSHWTDYE